MLSGNVLAAFSGCASSCVSQFKSKRSKANERIQVWCFLGSDAAIYWVPVPGGRGAFSVRVSRAVSGWRKKQIEECEMTPQQIEALNIAGQCRATASSPLAKNILVDECNGLLTELLLDAARIIEALAQPEQEPVAWADLNALSEQINSVNCGTVYRLPSKEENRQPLYTTPPQRKPLTDEQIMANDVLRYHFALNGGAGPISKKGRKVIDAIEAAHGIKENT